MDTGEPDQQRTVMCGRCGALVADRGLHTAWHDRMAEAATALAHALSGRDPVAKRRRRDYYPTTAEVLDDLRGDR